MSKEKYLKFFLKFYFLFIVKDIKNHHTNIHDSTYNAMKWALCTNT